MKTTLLLFVFSLLYFPVSNGQMLETDSTSQAEVSKLEFMVGKWKGSGWIIGRYRQKQSFEQTEDIQFKLDKTVILIEGLGMTDGKITHNALAVISYDK